MEKSIIISLKKGSEKEKTTQELLKHVIHKYPLQKWIFSKEIIIEEGARPHSYPTITLNTKRETEELLLAQFLHEQIHWIENGKEEQMDSAIKELKKLFPNVPVGRPEGADNEKSTYRHLIICRLEFVVLCQILGEEKAKEIVLSNSGYTWIRQTVIKDGFIIDSVIKECLPETLNH